MFDSSNRGRPYHKNFVKAVGFGEVKETSDVGVQDLVIVSLSTKTEKGGEHVNVITASEKRLR